MDVLVSNTQGFSGSDLDRVVSQSLINAVKRGGVKVGGEAIQLDVLRLEMDDFVKAFSVVRYFHKASIV